MDLAGLIVLAVVALLALCFYDDLDLDLSDPTDPSYTPEGDDHR